VGGVNGLLCYQKNQGPADGYGAVAGGGGTPSGGGGMAGATWLRGTGELKPGTMECNGSQALG
jgi:hypothetical protein